MHIVSCSCRDYKTPSLETKSSQTQFQMVNGSIRLDLMWLFHLSLSPLLFSSLSLSPATRPLLRQIEHLQSAHSAQANNWEKVENSLTQRIGKLRHKYDTIPQCVLSILYQVWASDLTFEHMH